MVDIEVEKNQTTEEIFLNYEKKIVKTVQDYIVFSKAMEKQTLEAIEAEKAKEKNKSANNIDSLMAAPLDEKKKKEAINILKNNLVKTKGLAGFLGVRIADYENAIKTQIQKINSETITNDEINETLEAHKDAFVFFDKKIELNDDLARHKHNQNPQNVLKILKSTEFSISLSFVDGKLTSTKEIVEAAKKIAESGQVLNIIIKNNFKDEKIKDGKTPYVFSSDEMKQIVELKKGLEKAGINELFFSEYNQTNGMWKYNDVIKANYEIESVAKKIKEMKLSPLEAMICVHQYAAQFVYNDGIHKNTSSKLGEQLHLLKQIVHVEDSRTVIGAIVNKSIVCVGYSRLVKALCDKLEMPGLKATLNACMVADLKNPFAIGSNHAQNIVEIVDAKYGIKGKFREDACWDSRRVIGENTMTDVTYANFLTSLKDISHLKGLWYLKDSSEDVTNIDYDTFKRGERPKQLKKKAKIYFKQRESTKKEFEESQDVVSIETFKKALKQVYLKTEIPQEVIDEKVEDAVEKSAAIARKIFNKRSKNPFKILGEEKGLKLKEIYKVGAVIDNGQQKS